MQPSVCCRAFLQVQAYLADHDADYLTHQQQKPAARLDQHILTSQGVGDSQEEREYSNRVRCK